MIIKTFAIKFLFLEYLVEDVHRELVFFLGTKRSKKYNGTGL